MKFTLTRMPKKNKYYSPSWQIKEIPGLTLVKNRGNSAPWHLDKDEELSRYLQWDLWENPDDSIPNHLWNAVKVGKILERQRFRSRRKALKSIQQALDQAQQQPNPETSSGGMTSLYL